MHARRPVTHLEGDQISVRVELRAADGGELPALVTTLDVAHADLLDPTATPALGVLTAAAVLRGEDLQVDGPVDRTALSGARTLARELGRQWDRPAPTIVAEELHDAPVRPGGVGLFFTRGADSWSTLLDLLALRPPERATHLVAVLHGEPGARAAEEAVVAGHRAVAAGRGLELVVVTTSARALLDPHREWIDTAGVALVSSGLVASAGLRRLVLTGAHPAAAPVANGTSPAIVAALSTAATEVAFGNPDRTRVERLAHLLSDPRARATLHVCWEGGTDRNCGRCRKCQLTMAGLIVAGDPDPAAGFDHGPDPACVRATVWSPALIPLGLPLMEGLPPEHEELRRAWADVMARAAGHEPATRWGDDAPPGLAGPSLAVRVATALRASTGIPDGPARRPLGWRPGAVPLRPALALHDHVRQAAASAPARPRPWAIVEHQVRDGRRDGAQSDLARAAHRRLGAGALYLPGVLWAPEQAPALDPEAVRRLLTTARVRLWWREEGDLDPLRTVESIESGCLPVQVMPDAAAAALRRSLPSALRACVASSDELTPEAVAPGTVATRLPGVVEHLLAGSAERDLLVGAHGD